MVDGERQRPPVEEMTQAEMVSWGIIPSGFFNCTRCDKLHVIPAQTFTCSCGHVVQVANYCRGDYVLEPLHPPHLQRPRDPS